MPITSYQVSNLISGQQAMFGNFSSYAQQISPGYSGGAMSYQNPMAGQMSMPMHPLDNPMTTDFGLDAMNFGINRVGPMLGTAALLGGSLIPGLGRVASTIDPFTGALSGFGRGVGWKGGAGFFSNMGNIAKGGMGGLLRGVSGAAWGALPGLGIGFAAQHIGGQMLQGAQYGHQVENYLQNQFRFVNPMSETGYGLGRGGAAQVSNLMRETGNREMMTSPQELFNVLRGGTEMGMFRAVQDAKDFKKRFSTMVSTLKDIAKTMNTTLEGALPFLQQARQSGFWTPLDIMRHAQTARATASATGMTVAQSQQMMGQGAQMARQVGALGAYGAEGMAQSLQLVGGALRGGHIAENRLSELTGGLQGPEAVQAMGGMLQGLTTRFASSRHGRWLLAALGGKGFRGFDEGRLQQFLSGNMGVGELGSLARRNVGREGAFNFVQNEQDLRGQLLRQGPQVGASFIRGIAGQHLYGEGARSQYITRRLIQRFFGGSAQEADEMANLARNMPQIMRENQQRSEREMDATVQSRERMMNETFAGFRRKVTDYYRKRIGEPLQHLGHKFSESLRFSLEEGVNNIFGITSTRHRLGAISEGAMHALQLRALGQGAEYRKYFASPQEMRQFTESSAEGMGYKRSPMDLRLDELTQLRQTRDSQDSAFASKYMKYAEKLGFVQSRIHTDPMREANVLLGRVQAGQTGVGDISSAQALGFRDEASARSMLQAAQRGMQGTAYSLRAFDIANREGLKGMRMAGALVREAQAGKFGAGLQNLVTGVSEEVAAFRLGAAQTPEQREGARGFNFGEMAEKLGDLSGLSREEREKTYRERMKQHESRLWKAIYTSRSSFWGGPSGDEIRSVITKGGQKLKDALAKYGQGDTEKERAINTDEAKREIMELAEGMDSNERAILNDFINPTKKNSQEINQVLTDMGNDIRKGNALSVSNIVGRRMERFSKSMGDQREKIFKGLTGISPELSNIVKELTQTQNESGFRGGIQSLISEAGTLSPEKAAQAVSLLKGWEGGGTVVQAIEASSQFSKSARMLTERSGKFRERVNAVQDIASMLGIEQITTKELKDLESKDPGVARRAQRAILGRMGKEKETQLFGQQVLQSLQTGKTRDLLSLGRSRIEAGAWAGLGDEGADIFHQKIKSMRSTDTMGEGDGTPKGMHLTMKKISATLEQIRDGEKTPGTKNPQGQEGSIG